MIIDMQLCFLVLLFSMSLVVYYIHIGKQKKCHICIILVKILISLKIDMLSLISIAALHIRASKEFTIQKLKIKISQRINFNSQLKVKDANWRVAIDIEI